ncbi:MAG: ribonuclease P protein component [Acidimicrobiales bacterium]|nr:ribonuclease P protein component [Acidimicrobiales bacterium]
MPHPVRSRRAFAALSARRDRGRSGPLWVAHAPLVDGDGASDRVEVAFAIGRAVGVAVVRNRLRRRLRVLMDERVAEGLVPGHYLVGARPGAVELTFDQLRDHLGRALGRRS